MINKRWYDRDPILKEALELLRLSPDTTKQKQQNLCFNFKSRLLEKL